MIKPPSRAGPWLPGQSSAACSIWQSFGDTHDLLGQQSNSGLLKPFYRFLGGVASRPILLGQAGCALPSSAGRAPFTRTRAWPTFCEGRSPWWESGLGHHMNGVAAFQRNYPQNRWRAGPGPQASVCQQNSDIDHVIRLALLGVVP